MIERDIQARLLVAAERMGTGLLRMAAALERIATVSEKTNLSSEKIRPSLPCRRCAHRADDHGLPAEPPDRAWCELCSCVAFANPSYPSAPHLLSTGGSDQTGSGSS